MSAQPDHAPVPPIAPAPGAPAELLAQLRADRRAAQWVPAFEREWAAALEESRRSFSLAALYEVRENCPVPDLAEHRRDAVHISRWALALA